MVFQTFTKYMLAFGVFAASCAYADDAQAPSKKAPTKEELFSEQSIDRLSQSYGHLIQRSLNNPMIKLNPKAVIQGIQDGMDGKPSPLTEKEYEEALTLIQQFAYEDMAQKNLNEAEAALKKNAQEEGVVVLEDGKVQYKIMKEGSGDAVTEQTMPTINYDATFSNGQKLGSSEQTGGPIEIKLKDTIPGFQKGILGMKVGEKRRVLIHPDFGFGKSGQLPNGLLVFEVEVTKVSPLPTAAETADDDDEDDDDDDLAALLGAEDMDDEDDDDAEDDLNYQRASSKQK